MYTELHCHSAYSFLDGASLPEELVVAALELGYKTLALTDHDGVWGSMEFAQAARALGLRALHGAELSLDDGRHLTLLVASTRGWQSLCRLLTIAHAQTRERLHDPVPPSVGLTTVCAHAEGIHCLSGCALHGVHVQPRTMAAAASSRRAAQALRAPLAAPVRAPAAAAAPLAPQAARKSRSAGSTR